MIPAWFAYRSRKKGAYRPNMPRGWGDGWKEARQPKAKAGKRRMDAGRNPQSRYATHDARPF